MYYSNLCLSFLFGLTFTFLTLFIMEANNNDPIEDILYEVESFAENVNETMAIASSNTNTNLTKEK